MRHAVCSLISGQRSLAVSQPWRCQLLWLRPQRVSGSLECLTVHSSGRSKANAFACPRCARRRLIQR
nr:Orf2a [uncultured bacterium]